MNKEEKIERPAQWARWVPAVAVGLALAVLGGTLAWAALNLRRRIDAQIVQNTGEILAAVTQLQHQNDLDNNETLASLADPSEQFDLALRVSRMRSVLGLRLYSSEGGIVHVFPFYVAEAELPAADLERLRSLKPVSHFVAREQVQDQILVVETNTPPVAMLLVEVPLHADDQPGQLAGVVQFLMDGSSIAAQFDALHANLALKFSIAFLVGAAILTVGLGLALYRVQRANRKLAERTRSLLDANRELALAARTSAVGAVASHLVHGLRNPLSGLGQFVRAHNVEDGNGSEADWEAALSTTQRMEELVNRVVRVLQDLQSGAEYEVSVAELTGMLTKRARTIAETAGVRFDAEILFNRTLSNRDADIILLILENLVQNAIEATPRGCRVDVRASLVDGTMIFEVKDQGAGLPPGMVERLFKPCVSAKKGGGGIGLAICRQLSQAIGATLELAGSNAAGCVFRLVLPEPRAGADQGAPNIDNLATDQPR
jgi:signal transduction histidine kinase